MSRPGPETAGGSAPRSGAPAGARAGAGEPAGAHRHLLIGGLFALLLLAPPLALLGASPPALPPAQGSASALDLPDNPVRGRALLESKQCVRCHGIVGTDPSIGPTLDEGSFHGTFLELGAALWNHVPAMSVTFEVTEIEWPQLSARQATELISFLHFIDYLGRPGVPEAGLRVFEARGCSSCHVIGSGEPKVGPDLADLQRYASPLSVAQEIWNHGPSMFESMRRMNVIPPHFEEGDLADLSAYIRQRAGPGLREPVLSTPGNPNRGAELFSAKGCATCHGQDARGGRGGPDLGEFDLTAPAETIAATMWNHSLAMNEAMRERGVDWPRFEGSELADVAAFLYFLGFVDPPGDPERGARVFVDRSCIQCHGPADDPANRDLPGPLLVGSDASTSAPTLVAAMWNHGPLMKEAILSADLPWPELDGVDLRDLLAYLATTARQP